MSWFFLWLERRRSRSPPEGDQGNDDPLGQGREAGTYQRKLRHRVGICPASTDLGIEPLAEDRVGKAAENCERSYRVEAGLRPARVAGKYECPEQGHAGDEDITASAMDNGKEDILHAPFRSEEHTSELQSLMRISYAAFCWKK